MSDFTSPDGSSTDIEPKLEEILLDALERSPEQREAFLARATDDPAIRRDVRRLLAVHARGDARFGRLAAQLSEAVAIDWPAPEHAGPYRLEEEIGRGGMSIVYRGVRDDGQFEQQVAVKLLPSGPEMETVIRRFQAERRILARLEHPNLARLLDGGVTDLGWPYVVMEYVDGLPITEYCEQCGLDIDQRIELFDQVLQVVQYAHRNLVVHRDLKPSNVLVTRDGQVKLLDFGIAKVIEEDGQGAENTELTRLGGRPMTPAWASPEQVAGDAVTTASDVYTLGVLLYRLLTGCSPYRIGTENREALRKAVLEQEPTAASARVLRVADDEIDGAGAEAPGHRAALARRLRGDLDTILQCAMRKEADKRYATVEQFADDLRRYRNRLPVRARADGLIYRACKFVKRHPFGVSTSILVPVALTAGLLVHNTQLQSQRDVAEAAAARAELEAAKTRQVSQYLVRLFEAADPARALGRETPVGELLDRGLDEVGTLDAQPLVQAEMFKVLGTVTASLGDYQGAAGLFESAVERLGGDSPESRSMLAETLLAQSGNFYSLGQFEQSERVARRVLDLVDWPDSDLAHRALARIGYVQQASGRLDAAEQTLTELVARRQDRPGRAEIDADIANSLGVVHARQSRLESAIGQFRRTAELRRELHGEQHPLTTTAMGNLGTALMQFGKLEQGLDVVRQALEIETRVLGPDHPDLAYWFNQLGIGSRDLGDLDAAERYHRRALELRRAHLGERHPQFASSLGSLAQVLSGQGDHEQARDLMLQSLDIRREQFGQSHPGIAIMLHNLAVIESELGKFDAATDLHRQALEMRLELLGDDHAHVGDSYLELARLARNRGDSERALELARAAERIVVANYDPDHPTIRTVSALRNELEGRLE